MPPTPEERRQRTLLNSLVGLSVTSLLMVLSGFVLGYFILMMKLNPKPKPKVTKSELPGPIIQLSDQVYNMGEDDRYLKGTFGLELNIEGMKDFDAKKLEGEVKMRLPYIQDLVIGEISNRTYRGVADPEGKERLKEDLRLQINALLAYHGLPVDTVKQVILTRFAIQ
jgi:flagellar basal body-associated protein FliL